MANKCEECGQDKPSVHATPCKQCKGVGRVYKLKDKKYTDHTQNDLKVSLPLIVIELKDIQKEHLKLYKQGICRRCNGNLTEFSTLQRNNSGRGKSYERVVAKQLKEWWSKHDLTCDFQRTPASGGSELKEGWGLAGDLCTNSKSFPLHIECKNQQVWQMDDIFTKRVTGLNDYIKQSRRDALKGKIPTVVFRHPGPSQQSYALLIFEGKPFGDWMAQFEIFGMCIYFRAPWGHGLITTLNTLTSLPPSKFAQE